MGIYRFFIYLALCFFLLLSGNGGRWVSTFNSGDSGNIYIEFDQNSENPLSFCARERERGKQNKTKKHLSVVMGELESSYLSASFRRLKIPVTYIYYI